MANYVKFIRGTLDAYKKLSQKQDDTLYFVWDEEGNTSLYLGEKLVSSSGDAAVDLENFSIDSLKDVMISQSLTDKSLLVYQINGAKEGQWIDVSFNDDQLKFIGATSESSGQSGFVPAPKSGMVDLFLCSNGEWMEIPHTEADEQSIDLYNNKMSLKNYGIQYYKYNKDTKNYTLQKVDQNNPWISGLEPRVIEENGKLVLGWFEPNLNTLDGIQDSISVLQTEVGVLEGYLGKPKTENTEATGLFAEMDKKANLEEVYSKSETEIKISESIAAADHLKRKVITSLDDIDLTEKDATQYIYMVSSGLSEENNKYYEYIVVENKVVDETTGQETSEKLIEKVGSWEVDLNDYAKKSDLLITSVNEDTFSVVNGKLDLNTITIAQVKNLETILETKVDDSNFQTISKQVEELDKILNGDTNENGVVKNLSNLTTTVGTLETVVNNLDNNYVKILEFNSTVSDLNSLIFKNTQSIEDIKDILTWKDLT